MKKMKTTIAVALVAFVTTQVVAQVKEDVITLPLSGPQTINTGIFAVSADTETFSAAPLYFKTERAESTLADLTMCPIETTLQITQRAISSGADHIIGSITQVEICPIDHIQPRVQVYAGDAQQKQFYGNQRKNITLFYVTHNGTPHSSISSAPVIALGARVFVGNHVAAELFTATTAGTQLDAGNLVA